MGDSVASHPVYRWTTNKLTPAIKYVPPPGGFGDVVSIAAAEDGSIYVYDAKSPTRRRALYLYDSAGRFVRQIGQSGTGPGEYSSKHPVLVALSGRRVLIGDHSLRHVLVYSESGNLVADLVGTEYRGSAFSRGKRGGFWMRLMELGADGVKVNWISYDSNGVVEDTIHVPQWAVPPLETATFLPSISAVVDSEGQLAAAWTGKLRVVREAAGSLRAYIAELPPLEYLPAERADMQRVFDFELGGQPPPRGISREIPLRKPVLRWVEGFDWSGNLWVLLHAASESGEEGRGRTAPLPPGMSSFTWEERDRVGAFDATGAFRGWVTLPPGASFMEGQGESIWGTQPSESTGIEVIRWRIAQ